MKQVKEKFDYQGLKIYVGLDIHKKTWHVTIFSYHLLLERFTYPPDPTKLAYYLHDKYKGAKIYSCFEAGYFGAWIHRELMNCGIWNIIVNPSDIPSTGKSKTQKRDPLDSKNLGDYLRANLLRGIYVLDEEQELDRQLLRFRKQLVGNMTRSKNRIKSVLSLYGRKPPEEISEKGWSNIYLKWIEELDWEHSSGKLILSNHLLFLRSIKEQLKVVRKQIMNLSESEKYARNVEILTSIRGFGVISSMVLLTELMPIERFENEQRLRSYIGLIPTSHSSGERERNGNITKRGNKLVKDVLIECAWRAVGSDPVLTSYYENACKSMTKNRAIIKVAVKLIRKIRAMLLKGEVYEINHSYC